MSFELKLRKIGHSLGVVIPQETLARLNAGEGDSLFLTESPENGFHLSAANSEFSRQMRASEKVMRRYRDTLRKLTK